MNEILIENIEILIDFKIYIWQPWQFLHFQESFRIKTSEKTAYASDCSLGKPLQEIQQPNDVSCCNLEVDLLWEKIINSIIAKIDRSASISASTNYRMKGHIEHDCTSQYTHPHTHQQPHPHFYRWMDYVSADANTS